MPFQKSEKEEEFFAKQELELKKRLRKRAEEVARRQGLSEELGVADEAVLATLEQMGFTRETATVLHLVPLAQVAWADGSVSPDEKQKILELAALRGVEAGSSAHEKLTKILTEKPAPAMFDAAIRVMKAVFESLPEDQRNEVSRDVVSCAEQVAAASGGFLGLGGKVSKQEQAAIHKVAQEFAESHKAAAKKLEEEL
jgi:tellurite resistance protein